MERNECKVNTDISASLNIPGAYSPFILSPSQIPPIQIEKALVKHPSKDGIEFYSFETRFNINPLLLKLIKEKCDTESNHMLHVAEVSNILCKTIGLTNEETFNITNAALLHDIGKIMISSKILFKPGRLSEEEFAIVKLHNVFGYRLLSSLDDKALKKYASKIALEHHEHIDGKGYMGLCNDEIEFGARIVAVADVFDALVSPRCYKIPWSFTEAANYIFENSATFFDREVVDAFSKSSNDIKEIYHIYNKKWA